MGPPWGGEGEGEGEGEGLGLESGSELGLDHLHEQAPDELGGRVRR